MTAIDAYELPKLIPMIVAGSSVPVVEPIVAKVKGIGEKLHRRRRGLYLVLAMDTEHDTTWARYVHKFKQQPLIPIGN